ncbi:MAG: hypothetical protein AABX59_01695 [Nanoarchaeota archaeon]
MIIKIPFRSLDKTEGTEKAPEAIYNALKDIWLTEAKAKINFDSSSIIPVKDNIDRSLEKIENESAIVMKNSRGRVIFLGGTTQ